MTRWPRSLFWAHWTPWGQTLQGRTRGWTGPLQNLPNPRTWAGGGLGGRWRPAKCQAQLGFLVGLRSPARGANHLCHTVTIILHKIIIKNPNFSASNPSSGLLAFLGAVSAGLITPLITSAWRLPPPLAIKANYTLPGPEPGRGGAGGVAAAGLWWTIRARAVTEAESWVWVGPGGARC